MAACQEQSPAGAQADPSSKLPEGSGFDFLVLSLSWSPSYCAAEGEDANRQQCSGRRQYAFVAHGLWPQFESGWPEFCASGEPDRVPQSIVDGMLDIMPSAGLMGHQWRKHGSCAGVSQRDYFALLRAAWERVEIPDGFGHVERHQSVRPRDVETSFLQANQGLPADGIAVTCDNRYLREVRICMTKSLEFRACEEVDRRACTRNSVVMPPARGR
ncbi:ribonuclease [Aquamicrobium sp. LC103]|uniref:ribonuclease T2 family protein n=1 Tax=Aquamicrobium sp. LC103 TaxID=1120658 RepID=UPI00063EA626|nr:ribonuclease [Aquamicrobium sp. LC103]TKT81376.1 ribonuclease [Aquamicrobium sp. LC103]